MLQVVILKEEQREKRREKEKKNDTGRPSSDEAGSAALFSKGAFIPYVTHFQKWKIQSHRVSSTLHQFHLYQNQDIFCIAFHKQGSYVVYIIFWPCGLLTFCNSFLIKVGHPENLLSLYLSSLQSPSGNRATFLWSKRQWVTAKKELINSRVLCC